jgi:type IV pilus assembly protein PilB
MYAAARSESYIVTKLVGEGRLDERNLQLAKIESEVIGLPLVEVLLERDVLSDEEAAQAYAATYNKKYLDLGRRQVQETWLRAMPENLARRKHCLPLGELGGVLVVAMADPGDPTVESVVLARFDRDIQFVICPRYQITAAHDRIYQEARARGAREADVVPKASGVEVSNITGMNMVELMNSVMDEAIDRRASDVHIEPEEQRLRIRFRIDGRMVEARAYPKEAHPAAVSRIKVLSKIDIAEKRSPQDGRFEHASFNQRYDVRVATIPTVLGERVTMRLLGKDQRMANFPALGMQEETEKHFRELIVQPHGIVLITGPTGSGKTTTLYTGLQEINTIDRNIITIENPVEYHIDGINQVQVDPDNRVSFAGALRSIVRHDPDVIMVGEIRDIETAALALEASLTGHLVFATLHTNSAVGAITRLLEMKCEPYLLASTISATMAQRLVRRICENCKQGYKPSESEKKILGIAEDDAETEIYRGRGCARCMRTGYYERVGVYEMVRFDAGLRDMVTRKTPMDELQAYATSRGWKTLRQDAFEKVLAGWTTLEDALRVTGAEAGDQ